MLVIFPYLHEGTWVFDDAAVGLSKEPFVAGIPEMINVLVRDIADADNGFKLLFSARPFPGYQVKLKWLRGEYDGNWYKWEAQGLEGWLCPALFKYFESAPEEIYCQAVAK
ncbi:MAG: hypothetical protein N5P05_003417 [Chroococcopsis gigantea SAG 12.99]|jgi:hypothetical protein|nr:hypothetical protein [Chroococcopsis gigantea SAG 12.99]